LFVICGLNAAALAVVNTITYDRILQNEEGKERVLRGVALAGAERGPQVVFDDEPIQINGTNYYVGRLDNEVIGATFTAVTNEGYGGPIEIVIGMNENKITGVMIKSSSETPGLGANASVVEYGETEPWFLAQFKDLEPGQVRLKKDDPTGSIDAITAATITSRAVTNAVHKEAGEFEKVWPQLRGQDSYVSAE
jgi:electron transport complex protein RnfG